MKSRIPFHKESLASRPLPIVCVAQVLLVLGSVHSSAHQGERIFPVFEITDDMLELIEVKDGRIDEWEELWEPSLTTLDFNLEVWARDTGSTSEIETVSIDPSDFDFRMWMGWNDANNRLYVSAQVADDIHVRERTGNHSLDYMYFHVDGDHTGGRYVGFTGEQYPDNFAHAQTYTAPFFFQPELSLGLSYNDFGEPYEFAWAGELPFASGGDGADGENPVVWTVEFFITPFDVLNYDPENSMVSELKRDKVIGFYISIGDFDWGEEGGGSAYNLVEDDGKPNTSADYFVDGVLQGAEGILEDSVVRRSSWGMVKASLGY